MHWLNFLLCSLIYDRFVGGLRVKDALGEVGRREARCLCRAFDAVTINRRSERSGCRLSYSHRILSARNEVRSRETGERDQARTFGALCPGRSSRKESKLQEMSENVCLVSASRQSRQDRWRRCLRRGFESKQFVLPRRIVQKHSALLSRTPTSSQRRPCSQHQLRATVENGKERTPLEVVPRLLRMHIVVPLELLVEVLVLREELEVSSGIEVTQDHRRSRREGETIRTFSLMYVISPSTSFFLSLERFCLLSKLCVDTISTVPSFPVLRKHTHSMLILPITRSIASSLGLWSAYTNELASR